MVSLKEKGDGGRVMRMLQLNAVAHVGVLVSALAGQKLREQPAKSLAVSIVLLQDTEH